MATSDLPADPTEPMYPLISDDAGARPEDPCANPLLLDAGDTLYLGVTARTRLLRALDGPIRAAFTWPGCPDGALVETAPLQLMAGYQPGMWICRVELLPSSGVQLKEPWQSWPLLGLMPDGGTTLLCEATGIAHVVGIGMEPASYNGQPVRGRALCTTLAFRGEMFTWRTERGEYALGQRVPIRLTASGKLIPR